MKLTNGETAKVIKRQLEHEQKRCDFCGEKIHTHNGEFIIETSSQEYVGYDHLHEVTSY